MAAVDELWLVCGVSPAEISAMRLDHLAFWIGRAVAFFAQGKSAAGAAPGSASQAVLTQQIDTFVKGFR